MNQPSPEDSGFLLPQAGGTPSSGWPPGAKWAVGCGSGCALLVLLEALVLLGSISMLFTMQPPSGLQTRITVPPSVKVGQKFPLTLTVENKGEATFRVQNLSARQATLTRLRLENPQPEPQTSVNLFGTQTWSYEKLVQPKDKLTVTWDATALEAGEIQGAIEAQVNLAPRPVRFTVKAEE